MTARSFAPRFAHLIAACAALALGGPDTSADRLRDTPRTEPMDSILRLGDCLSVMRTFPSEIVDQVVADPPYCSGGAFRGDRMKSTKSKYVRPGKANDRPEFNGDNRDQRGFNFWSTLWLSECLRVTKPGGSVAVFADWRQLPTMTDALQAAGWIWRGIGVWDKTEGARPQRGRFRSQCEFLVWGTKGPQPEALARSIGFHPGAVRQAVRAADKHHIAGKPTPVLAWAIGLCPIGGTVLDPFMGSGTAGVACKQTGRHYIGIENHWPYYLFSADRIAAAEPHQALAA